ncbi:MAG TPA: transposase, partial [Spirochaetia bacterium]|nr:transposase [Spirochaetia bacterium]
KYGVKEELLNEGIKKGEIKGKIEGKIETAKNMLKMKFEIDSIRMATGLSFEEIEKLK